MNTARKTRARSRHPAPSAHPPRPIGNENEALLLGDEAVALGALHAGITAAYAYPGTPSTEILERLIVEARQGAPIEAAWCANEKTAYEAALGVSMVGRRALVAMKHVGLNVALDPFMSSALAAIQGGLVVAVADDPGMHSSQNEQDSRRLADFASVPCLEPSTQQEAYDMTREAFALSEHHHVPVLIRIVTRLAHSRAAVRTRPGVGQNPLHKADQPIDWTLLPVHARRLWHGLLATHEELRDDIENGDHTPLSLSDDDEGLGILTTGIAWNYYRENLPELGFVPSHLHVGAYPLPVEKVRRLAEHVESILVLEEGDPFVERALRGVLTAPLPIHGKLDGFLPREGELGPDAVRRALRLPGHLHRESLVQSLPIRPPQLCQGCPHRDVYAALNAALGDADSSVVTGDIGCYTLGALPPLSSIESCICMGASIGMAKGASDAGLRPAVATIGDSTFLHSGVTGLMDAVAADTDMTLVILANEAVGMTGAQPTILPAESLRRIALGVGVHPDHCHLVPMHPSKVDELTEILRKEIAHDGVSVVIADRECMARATRRRAEEKHS